MNVIEREFAKLPDRSKRQTQAVWDKWQAGDITTDELHDQVVSVIVAANHVARSKAEVLAGRLLQQSGIDATPTGKRPPGRGPDTEAHRIVDAVGTMLADLDTDSDVAGRLVRLAGAEPTQAAQDQMRYSYEQHGADGWKRDVNAGACDLCQSWAEGDPIFPADVEMLHHANCRCAPIPATGD